MGTSSKQKAQTKATATGPAKSSQSQSGMKKGIFIFALFVALIVGLNQSGIVTKDALLLKLKENKDWLRNDAGVQGLLALVLDPTPS